MLRSALSEEEWTIDKSELHIPLAEFADRVSQVLTIPIQREEIRQAIIDMFHERDGDAFQWLTQVCGIYVMMCTLGFETLSSQEIIRVLSCFHLIPDSDVVLSLLCEGEENHETVEGILTGWKHIGGRLYMVRPVLEEVAYHAWISEYDYESFGKDLAILSDTEAKRLIDNAFVRAFRKLAGSSTDRKTWNQYITQYKGRSELDYAYVMEHLRDEYGFGLVPEAGDEYEEFRKRIGKSIVERLCDHFQCQLSQLDRKTRGKASRDSRLVTAIHASRCTAHAQGERKTYCLISSARLLKEVDEKHRDELGEPEMVLSIAAIGFLLTLTPQVQMSFGTLRAVLFDTYLIGRLTPAQRYAYRVIAISREWDVPWSRRGTLQRELNRTLLEQARSRGEPVKKVTDRVLKTTEPEFSAQVISNTLDNMGIIPKSRDETHALKWTVKKLEQQLADAVRKPKGFPVSQRYRSPRKKFRKK